MGMERMLYLYNIGTWAPNIGEKKTDEIVQFLAENNPDVFFITEENLQIETPLVETCIPKYTAVYPKTLEKTGVARIIALVRDGINIEVKYDWMEDHTSSIWMEIQRPGKKKLVLGSVYREQSLLRQGSINNTDAIPLQTARWNRFLKQWREIGSRHDTFLIGDLNLDMKRWDDPTYRNKNMVDFTKQEIITEGFTQLIKDTTRSWRGQLDSCVDHVWTNVPQLAISTSNVARCPSDHQAIGVNIRLKGKEGNSLEYYSRRRSMFNSERFRQKLRSSHWETFYSFSDPELANNWLEERLRNLLQEESPLRKVQPSGRVKSWVTSETLEIFKLRDQARLNARNNDSDDNWTEFRRIKNLATQASRKDKKSHYKNIFQQFEDKNDTQGLFKKIKKSNWGGRTMDSLSP